MGQPILDLSIYDAPQSSIPRTAPYDPLDQAVLMRNILETLLPNPFRTQWLRYGLARYPERSPTRTVITVEYDGRYVLVGSFHPPGENIERALELLRYDMFCGSTIREEMFMRCNHAFVLIHKDFRMYRVPDRNFVPFEDHAVRISGDEDDNAAIKRQISEVDTLARRARRRGNLEEWHRLILNRRGVADG